MIYIHSIHYIFIQRSTWGKYKVDSKEDRSSQKAQQTMPERKQDKILKEGTESPYLLTEAALKKHNIITGACVLREFACGPCDRYWWSVVPITKAVSKCHRCNVKYDALPLDKEFGIGRYICQNENCNNTFYRTRCEATQEQTCFNCKNVVRNPYIHPSLRFIRQRKPLNPNVPAFVPPPPAQHWQQPLPIQRQIPYFGLILPTIEIGCDKEKISKKNSEPTDISESTLATPEQSFLVPAPIQTKQKKRVINASTPHFSTGSTVSTFLSQIAASDTDPWEVPDYWQ